MKNNTDREFIQLRDKGHTKKKIYKQKENKGQNR